MKFAAGKILISVAVLFSVYPVWGGPQEGFAAWRSGDYAAAMTELRPLALQGNAAAQFALGTMYEGGLSVPTDLQQAAYWYRMAAEQGNALAQLNLGVMYGSGRGVRRDEQQAVAWFRKSADQGNAISQRNLGLMYASGEGVPADDRQAVAWFRKAADQGFAGRLRQDR